MSKILIIEDELSIAELERDYLELNDFEVEIETNGLKGLEKALDEEYSLILLDLMLPEVDGFEICRQIREKKDIPIIMVTAKKNDIDKIRGLGLGVDDYVTKPFSPSELVARVKAHISRYERLVGSTALKNDVIEIRGLKIDKTDRRVYVDNEEKVFTNKEFDILCFLASNPNKVFSKDELFSKIWNMDSIGDIATVTVHIKKIREKIEFDTSNPQYIETVWAWATGLGCDKPRWRMRRKQMKLNILHEDNDIIVAVKPCGVPTQPDKTNSESMVSMLKLRIYEKENRKEEPYLVPIHRLDRPVGGVMVFAKTPEAAANLSKQSEDGSMMKYYQAILTGELPN